jgi:hypothetical protein
MMSVDGNEVPAKGSQRMTEQLGCGHSFRGETVRDSQDC